MKKITKGAIAAGAAALLLAGGAGTFMEWNQGATLGGGDAINSGLLTLDTTVAGTWTLNGEPADITTTQIVPGDILQFIQPVTINAAGDNIQGDLSLVPGSITAADENPASAELATALTTGADFDLANASSDLTGPDEDGSFSFEGAGVHTADIVVNFDFGFDSVAGLEAQNGSVNLTGIEVAVTQTDATPAGTEPEIEP